MWIRNQEFSPIEHKQKPVVPSTVSGLPYSVCTAGLMAATHVLAPGIAQLSTNISGRPSLQLRFLPWPRLGSHHGSSMYTKPRSSKDTDTPTISHEDKCWWHNGTCKLCGFVLTDRTAPVWVFLSIVQLIVGLQNITVLLKIHFQVYYGQTIVKYLWICELILQLKCEDLYTGTN